MFERFTERARLVVVLAQDEARALQHPVISSHHLLLGLFREQEGIGSRVLASFGLTEEEIRGQIVNLEPSGETEPVGQIPFSERAKSAMQGALREALSLGHNYIGTEHILLGISRESEVGAALILESVDANQERIRDEVVRILSGPRRKVPPVAPPAPQTDYDLALRVLRKIALDDNIHAQYRLQAVDSLLRWKA